MAKKNIFKTCMFLPAFFYLFSTGMVLGEEFTSNWQQDLDRTWVGADYWANRLQDWRVEGGRLECLNDKMAMRTVHLLTRRIGEQAGTISISVQLGVIETAKVGKGRTGGVLLGAGAAELDYRAAALVQGKPGPDGGIFAGITSAGNLVIRNNAKIESLEPKLKKEKQISDWSEVVLKLHAEPETIGYKIILSAHDESSGKELARITQGGIESEALAGNIALVSGYGGQGARFWFRDWKVSGSKVDIFADRTAGPILSTQYTLSNNIMKITAQMMPLGGEDNKKTSLQVNKEGDWETIASSEIVIPGFTATFRVGRWDSSRNVPYRVVYELRGKNGSATTHTWAGMIRREPVDKDTITVAAFTGNHNNKRGFGKAGYPWNYQALWFPHTDLYDSVNLQQPDLLFFSGDQVYEVASPTGADMKNIYLDYLYKWYLWCWAARDLTKEIPCISIPDDHDVYQGNLWGQGGRKINKQGGGGYVRPAEFVKMVERTQASNLPDPYDPTPVEQGIGVYYTTLNYGGISFAVLEDRKFKTGKDSEQAQRGDPTEIQLLGERQLKFLRDWAADWRGGVKMKAALSQTVFCCQHTGWGGNRTLNEPRKPSVDYDSNGWPVHGRNRALRELRKGFAFMIGGDQHLATIIHHGVEEHDDSGWSLCVPSIANFYPRSWRPDYIGKNHQLGMPDYTGQYLDGFGNKITMWAAANPGQTSGYEPAVLHDRMPGYGVVHFDKKERRITMECWSRWADPHDDSQQYPGWPKTITMQDNYARKAAGYLPTIEVTGMAEPVVQVIDEFDGEIVYTLRIKGNSFRPKVFREGSYTVKIGEPGTEKMKILTGIKSQEPKEEGLIKIEF